MSDKITPALAHRVLDVLEQSPHIGPDGSLSALFIIRDAVKAWEAESDREEEAEFYAKVYHRARRRKSPVLAKWDSLPDDAQADNIHIMRVVLDRLVADGRLLPEGGTALTAEQTAKLLARLAVADVKPVSWYRSMEADFASEHFGFPSPGELKHTASDGGKWVWDESMSQWELREYPPAASVPDGGPEDPCGGTGTVECWNPGGLCTEKVCELCGPCRTCDPNAPILFANSGPDGTPEKPWPNLRAVPVPVREVRDRHGLRWERHSDTEWRGCDWSSACAAGHPEDAPFVRVDGDK